MRHSFRQGVGLTVILAIAVVGPILHADDTAPPQADSPDSLEDSAEIQAILEQVVVCREEVVSAEIRYLWHISTYNSPANTPEHVRDLINQFDLAGDPESLQGLVDALAPNPPLTTPVWDDREFFMVGEKRRADTFEGSVELVDSDHEITYFPPNRQLDVSARGNSSVHRTQIEDFRSFPPAMLTADRFRVSGRDTGSTTLTVMPPGDGIEARESQHAGESSQTSDSPSDQYTFDAATRVMSHCVRYNQGQVYEEIWQRALNEYDGGVVLPSLRIDTLYNNGILKSLTIWLIEEARLNGPVDEERFVMPVPENTILVDNRSSERFVRRIKNPIDDVRSILVPVATVSPESASAGGLHWRWILVLNGIVLVGLSIWLWKRDASLAKP